MAERLETSIGDITPAKLHSVDASQYTVSRAHRSQIGRWSVEQRTHPAFAGLVESGVSGVNAAMFAVNIAHPEERGLLTGTPLFGDTPHPTPNPELIDTFTRHDTAGKNLVDVFTRGVALLGVAVEATKFVEAIELQKTQTQDGVLITHKGINPPYRDGRDIDHWGQIGEHFGSNDPVQALSVSYYEPDGGPNDGMVWLNADMRTTSIPKEETAIVSFPRTERTNLIAARVDLVRVQTVPSVDNAGGFDALSRFSDAMHAALPYIYKTN